MGIKPISLQEKWAIQALVCHVVWKLEAELDPYGGMKHLMIRRGPAHAGEITEFYAMTGETDDG